MPGECPQYWYHSTLDDRVQFPSFFSALTLLVGSFGLYNCLEDNLYCVGGAIKPCSLNPAVSSFSNEIKQYYSNIANSVEMPGRLKTCRSKDGFHKHW